MQVAQAVREHPAHAEHLRDYTLDEFCSLEIPKREHILEPILRTKALAMLVAYRGTGKTYLGHEIMIATAMGARLFDKWVCSQPRRVYLVDGEMPGADLQERFGLLQAKMASLSPEQRARIRVLRMDEQDVGAHLNLATEPCQQWLEKRLDAHRTEFLILDNRSTLVNGGRENDDDSWDKMQSWLLRLRRKGIAVLMLEHAGRNGDPRGTSKREDALDTVITGKAKEAAGPNFILAVIAGIEPRDQLEAMLAMQMATIHNASVTFARLLAHVENIPQQDSASNALNKLMRTFTMQLDALKRYRAPHSEQRITVERVNVSGNAQAIVGPVTHGGGGSANLEHQAHATALSGLPPVFGEDAARDAVPVDRNAERRMPDARRRVARRTKR